MVPCFRIWGHFPWFRRSAIPAFRVAQEKDHVNFLRVLIDKNLTWRPHIDFIAAKISKIVGTFARLRHHCTSKYPSSNYFTAP